MQKVQKIPIKHFTDSIYYDLEQTARLMKKLGNQVFEKLNLGLTSDEYITLDTISCNAGICQRDLAKLILKDRANTGRILDTLEGMGLITTFIDTKNNRLVRKMGITEKGLKKLQELSNKMEVHFRNTTASFSEEEIDALQVSLRRFKNSIEEFVKMNI